MSKNKNKEIEKEILPDSMVGTLLREALNIFIPETLRINLIKWIAGDENKLKKAIKYANISGIDGVRQVIKLDK